MLSTWKQLFLTSCLYVNSNSFFLIFIAFTHDLANISLNICSCTYLPLYPIIYFANSLCSDQLYCLTLFITYSPSYTCMYTLLLSTYLAFHLAYCLDPDYARQNVTPDLELYCLTSFITYSPSYTCILYFCPVILGFLLAYNLYPDQA